MAVAVVGQVKVSGWVVGRRVVVVVGVVREIF